ncbi:hypothetical protein BJV82DRAFT_618188 [Fennellomyces sp. T-0311]|nr:hypothetical protein BJV82DRAFT_618188 [Fennellomyces sp. T-0311]
MSNATFSKNLYDILGDDNEVRQPAAPAKEKKVDETKANGEKRANGKTNGAPRGGAARGGRGAARRGRDQNGRQRGRQFDRHSGTGIVDSEKKEKQGWGHAETAEAEAAQDSPAPKDPASAEGQAAEVAEPEEQVKTYDEFLAEKAAKSLKVSLPEARKANEGSAPDAKFENAVAFKKEDEPDFYVNKDAKPAKKAEKQQRKEKVIVEIEQRFQEKPRGGFRGERRGGERRGGERRGRGNGRRGRQSNAPAVNIQDDAAFPSLGATA